MCVCVHVHVLVQTYNAEHNNMSEIFGAVRAALFGSMLDNIDPSDRNFREAIVAAAQVQVAALNRVVHNARAPAHEEEALLDEQLHMRRRRRVPAAAAAAADWEEEEEEVSSAPEESEGSMSDDDTDESGSESGPGSSGGEGPDEVGLEEVESDEEGRRQEADEEGDECYVVLSDE
jgi:hypothetical protein